MNRVLALQLLVGVALAALTIISPDDQYVRLLIIEILIYGLLAISFDLVFGYTGLLSLSQALFFGVSAYFVAFGLESWGLPLPAAALLAVAAGTTIALAAGYIAIRVKGHSFLIVTLIFISVAYAWAQNSREISGGDDGLVLRSTLFHVFDVPMGLGTVYFVVLGMFAAAFFATVVLIHSPFGMLLRAVRENEKRAEFLGYNTRLIKLCAFGWGGMLASLGGVGYTITFKHVHTGVLHWSLSADALIWAFFGGLGTLAGPLLGVAVLIPTEDYMSDLIGFPKLFTGALLVTMVLLHRGGLAGLAVAGLSKLAGGRKRRPAPAKDAVP